MVQVFQVRRLKYVNKMGQQTMDVNCCQTITCEIHVNIAIFARSDFVVHIRTMYSHFLTCIAQESLNDSQYL